MASVNQMGNAGKQPAFIIKLILFCAVCFLKVLFLCFQILITKPLLQEFKSFNFILVYFVLQLLLGLGRREL